MYVAKASWIACASVASKCWASMCASSSGKPLAHRSANPHRSVMRTRRQTTGAHGRFHQRKFEIADRFFAQLHDLIVDQRFNAPLVALRARELDREARARAAETYWSRCCRRGGILADVAEEPALFGRANAASTVLPSSSG